jgi:hypothetical protein
MFRGAKPHATVAEFAARRTASNLEREHSCRSNARTSSGPRNFDIACGCDPAADRNVRAPATERNFLPACETIGDSNANALPSFSFGFFRHLSPPLRPSRRGVRLNYAPLPSSTLPITIQTRNLSFSHLTKSRSTEKSTQLNKGHFKRKQPTHESDKIRSSTENANR